MSKLFEYPTTWKKVPPYTDAADVKENIDNWIARNNTTALENYCKKSTEPYAHKGYVFKTESDFTEQIINEQVIKRKYNVSITFTRYVTRRDIWFNPLYFTELLTTAVITFRGKQHTYVNDSRLHTWLKYINSLDVDEL